MRNNRSKTVAGIIAVGVAPLALVFASSGSALAHGYTQDPPSRSYQCKLGKVQNCGPIQWEPQSVEGPKGFPKAGPDDGKLCAANHADYSQLDDPRGGKWPATDLPSGQKTKFTWTLTAAHATTDFRYFITKDGWDPTKPLTRAALDPQPFASVDYGGKQPPKTVDHDVQLPAGKTGRHLIYAVWDIADTGNAFYSCADVNLS
ncbi:lytic polysaccharide monooxygenase auxiliary activity family 9 protein [Sciscionella sediminilitoris]|uniref:lytic polysaccharide monooxygenase auxiliary activity family 9 protein n=1 Tax=Sciscionella sediminilitoris TaxID=1445613 RepID=UPI0004DF9045|nr:lytic polysaccharide monooxygenase [Sciscionella sp. SE31]